MEKYFFAPDIEFCATIYSVPQPCKRCGSIRTYPLLGFMYKSFYKEIWEQMEIISKIRLTKSCY